MEKAKKLFYYVLLSFAFFPIIPNRIKGLPVIILFLIALFLFMKKGEYKFNFKKTLIYASLYIIYVISLLYSSNLNGIDKTLTTRLSILIFPLLFGLTNTIIINVSERKLSLFLWTYFVTTIIYCFFIVWYFYLIGFLTQNVNINLFYSHLTFDMWYINQHPIYASIFISIAIVFGTKLLFKEYNKTKRTILIIGLIILISMMLFLSRKGVLLAVAVALIIYLTHLISYKKLLLGIAIIVGVMFLISPVSLNRFKEIINISSYEKIDRSNSTSIRYGIYKCVFKIIREKPVLGHGIGDVKNKLNECYSGTSSILLKENYNSHNQYLSIWISNGFVGFIIFTLFLYINYKKAIIEKNHLFLSLLIFFSITMIFENILERQSGVIIFSLIINYFAFINIEKDRNKS